MAVGVESLSIEIAGTEEEAAEGLRQGWIWISRMRVRVTKGMKGL